MLCPDSSGYRPSMQAAGALRRMQNKNNMFTTVESTVWQFLNWEKIVLRSPFRSPSPSIQYGGALGIWKLSRISALTSERKKDATFWNRVTSLPSLLEGRLGNVCGREKNAVGIFFSTGKRVWNDCYKMPVYAILVRKCVTRWKMITSSSWSKQRNNKSQTPRVGFPIIFHGE